MSALKVATLLANNRCEEAQQKDRLGTLSIKLINYLGRGRLELVLLDPNPRTQLQQWFTTFGPHEGFITCLYAILQTKSPYNAGSDGDGLLVRWHWVNFQYRGVLQFGWQQDKDLLCLQ